MHPPVLFRRLLILKKPYYLIPFKRDALYSTTTGSSTSLQEDVNKDTVTPTVVQIKIPQRIERRPTDILHALKGTISRDPTGPEYKYHDDPYLIPYSNLSKKSYSLSKEAGKKAAMWVRQTHADLFQHRVSEPPIEAFWPRPVIKEDTPVDEGTLCKLIDMGLMSEAIKAYQSLKNQEIEIPRATKQKMLEFVAYYNETEPLDEDLIEERWYKSSGKDVMESKKIWKGNGLAESLFIEMDPPDRESISTMIRARAKYFDAEASWKLYQDAQSREIPLDTETYNALIGVANFLKESGEMVWGLIMDLLTDMSKANVTPNLGTLNATLQILSLKSNFRQSKNVSLQVLAEFRQLGIEPSLASYYYLLAIYGKGRGAILPEILSEIQDKQFTIQDPKDTYFFVNAMEVARYQLRDLEYADKVNQLLHVGSNYDLIGDSLKESIYYRHYFLLKCELEPFKALMEFYDVLVPNIYTPEPSVMEEILKSLELDGAFETLPKIWSDMIIFEQSNRENLIGLVLSIMGKNIESIDDEKLVEEFAGIGWKIWTFIETQERDRGRLVLWSGEMLGDLLQVLLKANLFDNACEIIKKLLRGTSDIVGAPPIGTLRKFISAALEKRSGSYCLACVQFINDSGYEEALEIAEEVMEKAPLDAIQKAKLNNIVTLNMNLVKRKEGVEEEDEEDDGKP